MPDRDPTLDITSTPEWQALIGLPGPGPARRAVRRRSGPRRAVRDRGRRSAHRLLQERRRRRRARRPASTWPSAAGVERRRDAMFAGEPINVTEHRAVLHTALAGTGRFGDRARRRQRRRRRARGARPRWRRSPTASAPTTASPTSSTSASAAPTSARRWRPGRSPPTATRGSRCHFVSNVDGADIARHARRSRPGIDAVRRVVQDVHARSRR